MTTDLDRLIEAVEEGQWNAVVAARIPGIRAQGDFAWKAFEGSIVAAIALLEALLPTDATAQPRAKLVALQGGKEGG